METIALRFAENFSPEIGTIKAHEELIDKFGHVWYGKMGSAIADSVIQTILKSKEPKILLIRSGKTERYWANVCDIRKELPPQEEIPEYYRYNTEKFKCWFKVTSFEPAERNIMSKCFVTSSKTILGEASKHSMSPYFKITYTEEGESL